MKASLGGYSVKSLHAGYLQVDGHKRVCWIFVSILLNWNHFLINAVPVVCPLQYNDNESLLISIIIEGAIHCVSYTLRW